MQKPISPGTVSGVPASSKAARPPVDLTPAVDRRPVTLELPTPPSVNALFANSKNGKGKGRFPTRAYKRWLAEADSLFLVQKWKVLGFIPVPAPCEISIRLPKGTRGDCSNRIKAAEDFLVSRGITGDDKHNRKVSIERDESLSVCLVTITPLEAA